MMPLNATGNSASTFVASLTVLFGSTSNAFGKSEMRRRFHDGARTPSRVAKIPKSLKPGMPIRPSVTVRLTGSGIVSSCSKSPQAGSMNFTFNFSPT